MPAAANAISPAGARTLASAIKKLPHPAVVQAKVPHLDPNLGMAAASGSGTTEVAMHGTSVQLSAAVSRAGGRIVASVAGAVTAVVSNSSLSALAASPGVTSVAKPDKAYVDGTLNQGVAASNAPAWQTAEGTASANVGIVDGGFANLASEENAGNLPAAQVHFVSGQNHCANVDNTGHGTAVAEIVHQMAPAAQLYLYCIDDSVGFKQAGAQIQAAGNIKIVTSSLAFPADSRGDGTGYVSPVDNQDDSAATTVKTARQSGLLWIQSAGNEGVDHIGSNFQQGPDGFATFTDAQGFSQESDGVKVAPGGIGSVVLQWDQWPVSSVNVTLVLAAVDASGSLVGAPVELPQTPGTTPALGACVMPGGTADEGCFDTNSIPAGGQLVVGVQIGPGTPALRWDLSYWGEIGADAAACAQNGPGDSCLLDTPSAQSMATPADSPFAFAVGAADASGANDCGADLPGTGTYPLEAYSSEGPTIDGRTKPDITGFDAIVGNAYPDGFCGTSAAAPGVAGAAALLAGANPALDASQLQSYLEQHASGAGGVGAPNNPPLNSTGHGVLNLGPVVTPTAPAGSSYTPLATPNRVLDTRLDTSPTRGQKLQPGQAVPVSVGAPAGATAVALNLTGSEAAGGTFLAVYAGGLAYPGTSNLNLQPPTDSVGAVFAVATLSQSGTITVYNDGNGARVHAIVDVLGFFSNSGTGLYSPQPSTRIVDTRDGTGGYTGKIANNQVVRFTPLVPAGTTAVAVNVTGVASQAPGLFTLAATDPGGNQTSTLNFNGADRANLTVVSLDSLGSFVIRGSGASAFAVVDIVGVFSAASGARYVPLPSPVRVVDTRYGNGGRLGPLTGGAQLPVFAAGLNGVPYAASAVLTGLVAVPASASFLSVFADTPANEASPPNVSTVNFTPFRNVPNAAIANLNPANGSAAIYNQNGSVDAVMDLFGYFS